MAINPNNVNILNVEDLNNATGIDLNDLLVIGQGIYARKATILQVYNLFEIDVISQDIENINLALQGIDVSDVLRFTEQTLQGVQQTQSRTNINATDRRLAELASDLNDTEKGEIQAKLGITNNGSTSLFDDIFIYNETENPDQEFELSFLPYQIVTVLDNNQMKWLDDGDYEINGSILKMLYPLENETKLRINYYHNL